MVCYICGIWIPFLPTRGYCFKKKYSFLECTKFFFDTLIFLAPPRRADSRNRRFSLLTNNGYKSVHFQVVAKMVNSTFAEEVRGRIKDDSTYHNIEDYGPFLGTLSHEGTSHISVQAANGDAVSVTNTINYRYWCQAEWAWMWWGFLRNAQG